MATLEIVLDDSDEVMIDGYRHVEWLDDVQDFKCTRCSKVLVQHFVANCAHKFCANCKRLLDDGSQQWKCPRCKLFIVEIEHLKDCKDTREKALPVPLKGDFTVEQLERMFSAQMEAMRNEMKEMQQKVVEVENKYDNRDREEKSHRESSWELSLEMERMKRVMLEIKKKQKDGKGELRAKLSYVNDRIDGGKSDLTVETTRLKNDVFQLLQKQEFKSGSKRSSEKDISSVVEENKANILKLEGKCDSSFEMMQQIRNSVDQKINGLEIKIEKEMDALQRTVKEMEMTQNNKWAEVSEKMTKEFKGGELGKCFAEIINVKEKYENLNKKLDETKSDLDKASAETLKILNEQMVTTTDRKLTDQLLQINSRISQEVYGLRGNITMIEKHVKKVELRQSAQEKTTEISIKQNNFQLTNLFLFKISQLTTFDLVNGNHSHQPDFAWKITGITNKLKEDKFEEKSDLFKWIEYPVQARAKIKAFLGQMYISMTLEDKDEEVPIDLKIIPNVYYVLKDRSGKSKKHRCETKGYAFGTKFSNSLHFRPLEFNKTWLTDDLYNVEDSVEIEVYVEPPVMTQIAFSYNGKLNWAMDNYRKRKQMAKEGLVRYHESPCFYTGPKGYRVQIVMVFNDYLEDEGKGLRADITFLTGEFDADLPSTFAHQTTITLFHQKESDMSITKQWDNENSHELCAYSVYLCSNSELESLIENDTLLYNVTIKALDIKET